MKRKISDLNDVDIALSFLAGGFGIGWDDYEVRKVGRWESAKGVVDTAFCNDTGNYETGIAYEGYNYGEFIIVEEYSSKENALKGHKSWVSKIKKGVRKLEDIFSGEIYKLVKPSDIKTN